MTTHEEPRALADLARALTDQEPTDKPFSPDLKKALLEYEGVAMSFGQMLDGWERNQPSALAAYEKLIAVRSHVAALIDAWQAPPSPDAGAAFAEADVELDSWLADFFKVTDWYMSATFLYGNEDMSFRTAAIDKAKTELRDHIKAALLAFAPGVRITPTITEDDSQELRNCARDVRRVLNSGTWIITTEDHDMLHEMTRKLEAVAAARQRATGSGVTG